MIKTKQKKNIHVFSKKKAKKKNLRKKRQEQICGIW